MISGERWLEKWEGKRKRPKRRRHPSPPRPTPRVRRNEACEEVIRLLDEVRGETRGLPMSYREGVRWACTHSKLDQMYRKPDLFCDRARRWMAIAERGGGRRGRPLQG